MQRKKNRIMAVLLLVVMLVSMLASVGTAETYDAATSYTNAKEFYESTALNGEYYHVETVNGTIYYATKAKLASSSTNLRYRCMGFDIELSGNGASMSIAVKRDGGSMRVVDVEETGGYSFNLYAVEDDVLYDLAMKKDPTNAAKVLSASVINVRMNGIMATRQGNTTYGGFNEDGKGDIDPWGRLYRLKNAGELNDLMDVFSTNFRSYTNIIGYLSNYQLQIRYNILGLNPTGSAPTVSSGYSANASGILLQNGSTYITKGRVLQKMTLLNHGSIGLAKKGYHLSGGSEWVTNDSRAFATGGSYMPQVIDPIVGTKDRGITLYANWQPNTYKIIYNANGGTGTVAASKLTYDAEGILRANTFSRTGYYLPSGEEWNTRADGTGTSYSSGEVVKNLTSTNGAEITLYANWKPCVYEITTDKQGGSGGTDRFFEKYAIGFFKESTTLNLIQTLVTPSRTGYNFLGYFPNMMGTGPTLVDENGNIVIGPTQFAQDSIIYASYEAKQYRIIFDKQGGFGGTNEATATYDKALPTAVAPIRTGYSFKGYFTEPGGKGEMYYNEFMASDVIYQTDGDMTLYAHWVDESAPTVHLVANIDEWTNRDIVLTVSAYDYGTGLSSLKLYQGNVLVKELTNLNGSMSEVFTFDNTTEGVINYKAVATDMNGNTAEVFETVKYDIQAPTGEIVEFVYEDGEVSIIVDVTDINVQ